ncbi:MAG: TrkH family potassium uptake protein [Thermodesulfobacteriota bacterium]
MREREYLITRYRAILSYSGVVLMLGGGLILTPLAGLAAFPGESRLLWAFAAPGLSLGVLGALLWRGLRPPAPITVSVQEGGVIVLFSWVAVIAFSAWPFVVALGLSVPCALFESVSGWTTTGLSVVDVTRAGNLILLWRSIMQLAGGAGLAIIMMSSIMGPAGAGLSVAEGRGDQLVPQVRRSARLVLLIYSAYAAVGVLLLKLAGMSLFDAVNHSFAAVSTGGFSTYPESIGHWDKVSVEAVILPLMVLGNLSFVTAWFMWRGRRKAVIRNGEVRLMAVLVPLSVAALFLFTCRKLYPLLTKSLRVALFEGVSALTTTGFSTVGYGNWNSTGILVLVLLMLIGGGTCSTAGGIKQFRIHALWKFLAWEVRRWLSPCSEVRENAVWEGDSRVFVRDDRARQVGVFVFLYMAVFATGTLVLCACGFNLSDALFEFASALGTVGLSVGVTSAGMPAPALWAETVAMLLGRLEFLVVVVSVLKISRDLPSLLAGRSGR